MRILQVNKFFYEKGGSEKYFFNLIKLLEEQGNEVISFSMQHQKNKKSKYSKYFIPEINYHSYKNIFSKAHKFIKNKQAQEYLEKLISKTKPEIAHLHNIHHQLTPAITETLKKHNIPIVQTAHDYQIICPSYLLYTKNAVCQRCKPQRYYQCVFNKCVGNSILKSKLAMFEMYYNRKYRDYLKHLSVVICPSKFQAELFKAWGVKTKIKQLYNFTAIKPLDNIEQKDYYLYFGRLSRGKGLTTLVKTFKQLPQKKLQIVGTGSLAVSLKKIAKDAKNINFLGYKSGDTLTKIIQQAHSIIIPSELYDNNPLVALESLSLNKWVIAADIGGLTELIKPGENGELFKAGDVKALKAALNKKQGTGQKSQDQYNKESHYQQLMEIYEQVNKR